MPQQTINTPRDSTLKTTEQAPRNIADVLADELSGIAQAIADGGSTDYDDLSHKPQVNSVTLTGDKSSGDLGLASQEDLTSIKATGTTNATGGTITKGKFFYLNDELCQAKVDIASGATFTLNTNYEEVTAGGLNALNSKLVTLLWTNQSPTAEFAPQGVPMDLSNYDLFILVFDAYNNSNNYKTQILVPGKNTVDFDWNITNNNSRIFTREVTISNTGVAYSTGYQQLTGATVATAGNGYIIPLKLYGFKVV